MDFLNEKPSIVTEAQKAKFSPNAVIQCLLFFAVMFVSQLASGIIPGIYTTKKLLTSGIDMTDQKALTDYSLELVSSKTYLLMALFFTVISTVLIIVYCRFIEKRSLYSMGFVKKKAFLDYIIGLIIGLVMFSAAVLICYAKGTLTYDGVVLGGGIGFLLLFFLGYFLQGMSEEVLYRGYFMVSVGAKAPLIVAILLNSLLFSLMHLFNPGVKVLAIVNIILVGIFFSVYMLKSDSIWGVCAAHTMWNFVQGNLFGIKVSGLDSGVSVLKFSPTFDGVLFNGGDFGLEGGLGVTIVLVISIAVVLLWKGKKSERAEIEETVVQ